MRFLKYEFESKEAFDTIKALHLTQEVEGETVLINGFAVVEVGYITLEAATYNEQGETITEAVLSPFYAVDILWQSIEPIEELEAFEVYPSPCGIHSFSGLSYLYDIEYYKKFPELKPIEQ